MAIPHRISGVVYSTDTDVRSIRLTIERIQGRISQVCPTISARPHFSFILNIDEQETRSTLLHLRMSFQESVDKN